VIDAIYSWLITHPLSGELIVGLIVGFVILFFTPILAPIVDTFWKFCAIRPQRLNVWVLKARLSVLSGSSIGSDGYPRAVLLIVHLLQGDGLYGVCPRFFNCDCGDHRQIDFHRAANDAQGWIYHLARISRWRSFFGSTRFSFVSSQPSIWSPRGNKPREQSQGTHGKVAKLEGSWD